MMKKNLLLALLLLVTASAFAVEKEIDGLWYELNLEKKEAKVIKNKNNVYYSGNIVIPETVAYGANYSVKSIGSDAFYQCSDLTSVTIGNSVTSIGSYAFYGCSGLTSVTIPGSVTSIGSYAFSNCSGLTSVTIPSSVTSIGNRAFRECSSLTSMVVEEGNTKYDSRNNCNAIIETKTNILISGCKTTVIPSSVMRIGNYAFNGCTGLTTITIPNSVTSIGDDAFAYCI